MVAAVGRKAGFMVSEKLSEAVCGPIYISISVKYFLWLGLPQGDLCTLVQYRRGQPGHVSEYHKLCWLVAQSVLDQPTDGGLIHYKSGVLDSHTHPHQTRHLPATSARLCKAPF